MKKFKSVHHDVAYDDVDLDSLSYPELAEMLLRLEEDYEYNKSIATDYNNRIEFLKRNVIPARLDADGIQNVTVNMPDGSKRQFVVIPQISVKTPPENKELLWRWLRDHGAEHLISETVNSSTLAGFVREQMRLGQEYPHDICEVNSYDVASLRKA